jgi:ribosomal protein L32E
MKYLGMNLEKKPQHIRTLHSKNYKTLTMKEIKDLTAVETHRVCGLEHST